MGHNKDICMTHMLFIDAFLQNNRLDHVTQVMGYHPLYLDIFLKTQNFILRGDGPLPYDFRHIIAIMAAGRHKCSYLINLQKQEFLLQGGESSWLKGLKAIPQKLRDLYEINKILAHRPWLLNKTHIEKLTKGTESWSLAEVVHAIVILTHFHALSSFVFGCGVNEELDQDGGHRYGNDDRHNSTPKSSPMSNNTIWSTPTLERQHRELLHDRALSQEHEEIFVVGLKNFALVGYGRLKMKSKFEKSKKMYRVRFKCEVQVIEYDQTSSEGEHEEWDDKITTGWTLNKSKPPLAVKETDEQTSKIAGRLCIIAILAVALYKWWTVVMQT